MELQSGVVGADAYWTLEGYCVFAYRTFPDESVVGEYFQFLAVHFRA